MVTDLVESIKLRVSLTRCGTSLVVSAETLTESSRPYPQASRFLHFGSETLAFWVAAD